MSTVTLSIDLNIHFKGRVATNEREKETDDALLIITL